MVSSGGQGYLQLRNVGRFAFGTLEHIFEGDFDGINAGGYHYEGIANTPGCTVPGTKKPPNQFGAYKAKVTVYGVLKASNGSFSTFFPLSMSPQDVVDAINEAYDVRQFVAGSRNTYRGVTSSGMPIEMYLDAAGKIISAFPLY